MIILISGTPGTGKTTVSKILAKNTGRELIRISELASDDVTIRTEKDTKIVDVEKLKQKIKRRMSGSAVVDGHLSHLMDFGDLVIVLRTDPKVLKKRLIKKGFDKAKTRENLEAEALDVCLIESVERHKNVFEIDTTEKSPQDVAGDIIKIVEGNSENFKPGKIDWSEIFFKC